MKARFFFIIPILFIMAVANSQDFSFKKEIVSPYRFIRGKFGINIAISGNYAIIGVPEDPMDVNNSDSIYCAGAAYIYARNEPGEWTLLQKLTAPARDIGESFGTSVAISGNIAVIGARGEDYDTNESNFISGAGAAYIYELDSNNNWVEIQKVVASNRSESDYFGDKVAVSGDFVAVSATNTDNTSIISWPGINIQSGTVYVFERDSLNYWSETNKLNLSSQTDYINFGSELSLSNNTLVTVLKEQYSMYDMSKHYSEVFIYEKDSSSTMWIESSIVYPDDITFGDGYANSVCTNGDYVIVGANSEDKDKNNSDSLERAGAAYIFTKDTAGNWTKYQKITASNRKPNDYFGSDVSISENKALISAKYADKDKNDLDSLEDSGLAYIFELKTNGQWEEKQIISASLRQEGDLFGYSVAISGNYLISSSPYHDFDPSGGDSIKDAGAVFIYEQYNSNASQVMPVSNNIKVYPNPATDYIKIETDIGSTIQLYNLTGILIYESKAQNSLSSINTSGLHKDIYLVRIKQDNQILSKKIVIQ